MRLSLTLGQPLIGGLCLLTIGWAAHAAAPETSDPKEASIIRTMDAKGYIDMNSFTETGNVWQGQAIKAATGQTVTISVNPDGSISEKPGWLITQGTK